MKTEIRTTTDGSHTLYVPEIDESYHSTHGAIQESMHIFLNTALKCSKNKQIKLLEVGFGTGLNAFLTAIEAENSGKKIQYTTLEKFPVSAEITSKLNYSQQATQQQLVSVFDKIHQASWEKEVQITDNFSILKLNCDFEAYQPNSTFDVVYFDAFSPEKQPEMWTEEQFIKIYNACNVGAILTTYCAKGIVRRALQTAGFKVERLPGPPGKREILRATK